MPELFMSGKENPLLSEAENKVWVKAKKYYEDHIIDNISALPNLLGTLAGISLSRGKLKNLFKRSNVGILGFKKYAEKLRDSGGDKFVKAFDSALKYLKDTSNYPKGALKLEKNNLMQISLSELMSLLTQHWQTKIEFSTQLVDVSDHLDFWRKFDTLEEMIGFINRIKRSNETVEEFQNKNRYFESLLKSIDTETETKSGGLDELIQNLIENLKKNFSDALKNTINCLKGKINEKELADKKE